MTTTTTTTTKLPTVADVIAGQEALGKHFFSPKTMAFFGDTIDSFAVTEHAGKVCLYRKPSATVLLYTNRTTPCGRAFFGAWYVDEIGQLDKVRDGELDDVYEAVMGYVTRPDADVKAWKKLAWAWKRLVDSKAYARMYAAEVAWRNTGERIPAPERNTRDRLNEIENCLQAWSEDFFTGRQLDAITDWANERGMSGLLDD